VPENQDGFFASSIENQKQGLELVEKVLRVAEPGAVFGEPTAIGDKMIITASEVVVTAGFGFGRGTQPADEDDAEDEQDAYGEGGGGGGFSVGRPVAAITVGPEGVEVKPIMDLTKVWIALLTTVASMFAMRARLIGAPKRRR